MNLARSAGTFTFKAATRRTCLRGASAISAAVQPSSCIHNTRVNDRVNEPVHSRDLEVQGPVGVIDVRNICYRFAMLMDRPTAGRLPCQSVHCFRFLRLARGGRDCEPSAPLSMCRPPSWTAGWRTGISFMECCSDTARNKPYIHWNEPVFSGVTQRVVMAT